MTQSEFQQKIDGITKKLGDEASNLVLDDIGLLLTDNSNMNKEKEKMQKEIEDLKSRNEMLQNVNGNLLMQVTMDHIEKTPDKKEEKIPYDIKKSFNSKGEFI